MREKSLLTLRDQALKCRSFYAQSAFYTLFNILYPVRSPQPMFYILFLLLYPVRSPQSAVHVFYWPDEKHGDHRSTFQGLISEHK